jgi:hypothetical protein
MNTPQEPMQQPNHYEVCNEGSLTYFNYYFEDILPPSEELEAGFSPSPAPAVAPYKPVMVGLVGAGLAATAVAGYALGNHNSQNNPAVSSEPVARSQADQTRKLPTAKISPTAPESINGGSFSSSGLSPYGYPAQPTAPTSADLLKDKTTQTPQKEKTGTPKAKPISTHSLQHGDVPTKQPLTVSLPEMLPMPAVASTKAPEQTVTIGKTVAPVPVTAALSQPPAYPPLSAPAAGAGLNSVSPSVSAFQALTGPAKNAPVEAQAAQSGNSPGTVGETPAATSAIVSPVSPRGVMPSPLIATPVQPDSASATTPEQTSARPVNLSEFQPARPNSNRSATPQTPSKIQDFIALPQRNSQPDAVKLLPLTQQAAAQVQSSEKIEQFTVHKLAPQDYQREWQISTKTPAADGNSTILPTYGFIDYQRQMIVVLLDNPQQDSRSQVSFNSVPNTARLHALQNLNAQ